MQHLPDFADSGLNPSKILVPEFPGKTTFPAEHWRDFQAIMTDIRGCPTRSSAASF